MRSTRRPDTPACRRRLSAALLSACLLAPSSALSQAQTLDLGPPAEPAVGKDSALARLERRLAEELARHAERLENAIGAGDPDWRLAASLSVATRALAMRMLAEEPSLPGARSIRIMQANTIANLAPAIDELARAYVDLAFQTRGVPPDDPRAAGVATRAETGRAAISAFLRAAASSPENPATIRELPATIAGLDRLLLEAFDELRPALRVLAEGSPGIEPAWPLPPGVEMPPEDAIESARRAAAVLDETHRAEVSRLLDALADAERLPIHRRRARLLARSVAESIEAAESLAGAEWLDGEGDGVRALVGATLPGLFERTDADDAARVLGRIRRLGAIARDIAALDTRRVKIHPPRRALRTLVGRVLDADASPTAPGRPRDHGRLDDVIGVAERTLATSAGRPLLAQDHFENAMVRRAWRLLGREYEEAERRALDALSGLVDDPPALTSPDTISLLKKHRDAAQDLRRVANARRWQDQMRSVPSPGDSNDPDNAFPDGVAIERSIRAGAADRLEALVHALGRDRVRDQVLDALTEFETAWTRFASLPGEDVLRREHPAAVAATGGRAVEVLAAMRRDRQDWLVAWAAWRLDDAGAALGRLDRHERIGRAIETCVLLSEPERLDALDRWAAVELSRSGVGVVRRRAKEATGAMIDAMLAGDWNLVDRSLEWESGAPTARLVVRLAFATDGADWPDDRGAASLVAQLGSGVGREAWLRERRVELAGLSRWIGELGVAVGSGDAALAPDILAYLDDLSRRVLESIDDE